MKPKACACTRGRRRPTGMENGWTSGTQSACCIRWPLDAKSQKMVSGSNSRTNARSSQRLPPCHSPPGGGTLAPLADPRRRPMTPSNPVPPIVPETPKPSTSRTQVWGSDAIARMPPRPELPYVALVPGASFRGLHDSLVNDLGNKTPQMLTCVHEESAVAIAHGYAKASGQMMGAILHSNVGLLHASMAIFNA